MTATAASMQPLPDTKEDLSWFRGDRQKPGISPLSLLMIQATRFCNIDCRYCYLPDRSSKARARFPDIEALARKILSAGLAGPQLDVVWHAGEPTVLPVYYYKSAIEIVNGILSPHSNVRHQFQVNATLLTDDYCQFFRDYDIQVGVSIDGPQRFHDAARRTRSGAGTFDKVMAGMECLRKNGIPFSTISVLTRESLLAPDEMFAFFVQNGIQRVGFSVEEAEGANRQSAMMERGVASDYKSFLRRFHALNESRGRPLSIREFDVPSWADRLPTQIVSEEANELAIISMDADGRIYTFSPELVDLRTANGGTWSIGHIQDIRFEALYENEAFLALKSEIARGVELCRTSCQYFSVCGGGAPANKLSENGSFASGETGFCRLTRKALADVALELFPDFASSDLGRTLPAPGTVRPEFAPDIAMSSVALKHGRVTVCRRTVTAEGTAERDLYEAGAIVPEGAWEPLDAGMIEALMPRGNAEARPVLSVLKVADDVRDYFETVRGSHPAGTDARLKVAAEVGAHLIALHAKDAATAKVLGAACQTSGRLTTTFNEASSRRIGLHLDSWSGLPMADRRAAPARFCLNFGSSPRYLLVCATSIASMARWYRRHVSVDDANPTDVARAFLANHPEEPIFRIEVRPGEAYIAPTEYLAHDGSSVEGDGGDFTYTILGDFTVRPKSQVPLILSVESASGDVQGSRQGIARAQICRPAVAGDLPHILALCAEMHAESVYRTVPLSGNKLASFVQAAMQDDEQCVFVATKAGRPVGVMIGRINAYFFSNEKAAYETILFVQKSCRGGRYARALMLTYLDWARRNGAVKFWPGISTGIDFDTTTRFYQHFGFEKVGAVLMGDIRLN